MPDESLAISTNCEKSNKTRFELWPIRTMAVRRQGSGIHRVDSLSGYIRRIADLDPALQI